MIISHFAIHNFRSISHQSLSLVEFNLLVGMNNSGKTTIIDCIRAFYEKDKYSFQDSRDFPKMEVQDNESWVEITFLLTPEEIVFFDEDILLSQNQIRIRKYFKTDCKLEDGKPAKGAFLPYVSDEQLKMKSICSSAEIQRGKLGSIVYIPAANKVDDFTKLSGPSALRDLLSSVLTDAVSGSSAYDDLSKNIGLFADSIKKAPTSAGISLETFENDLNGELAPWSTKFSINFVTPNTADIIKNMLVWSIQDKCINELLDIDSFGSGMQRHFIYSVIKIGSSYMRTTSKREENYPNLNLLLFEEPEAFLHPDQQQVLAIDLRKMSKINGWQVLASTHSSHFVSRSMFDLHSLIHIEKKNAQTLLYQVTNEDLIEIADKNRELSEIAKKWPGIIKGVTDDDFTQEMDALKFFMYFNSERSGAFFSNHVLLVEGPSEVALINRLRDLNEIKLPFSSYIMDCLGKYNVHRFMNLFGKLGISHSVLCDSDASNAAQQDVNKLIEESRNQFTKTVAYIDENLERFLGVPKCERPDKKPQSILLALEKGLIEQAKKERFITCIESLF